MAPEDVAALLLQLPVAEGYDDMLVLQSLRLMDGEDAYATGLVALDGLRTEGLLPLGEEGCNISSVLVDEVDEVVVESADVGTLRGKAFEGEDGIEALGEVIEGRERRSSKWLI